MGARLSKGGNDILIDIRQWHDHQMRLMAWRGRIAVELRKGQCSHCYRQGYCRRLEANDFIYHDFLSGKGCYDYVGVWDAVFGRVK